MSDFKKILCPTDFSDNADYALRYASALARKHGGSVDVVHVVDSGVLGAGGLDGIYVSSADVHHSIENLKQHAQQQLDHLTKKEHLLGVEVTPHLREGHAADEVAAASDELGSDLIVVATHGRHGLDRLIFGSTCDKILRIAKVPVLSIKHPEREFLAEDGKSLSIKHIFCPLDFSEFSHSALPQAEALAREFGAEMVLAHVVDARFDYPEWTAQTSFNNSEHLVKSAEENLERSAKEIEDIAVSTRVGVGVPARTLVEYATDAEADLIVLPTHGRTGLSHALLGSVAERVVRYAPCPVLTVRP